MTRDVEQRLRGLSPAKQALWQAWINRRERQVRHRRIDPARTNRDELPLSFAQERIWLHQQLVPLSIAYNRPANVRLRGSLNVEALRRALDLVVARHESLRTTVRSAEATPALCVHPHVPLELPLVDLSCESSPELSARRLAAEEGDRPFDLELGPLWRSRLLRIGNEDHLLLLTFHHFTYDAWSHSVLLKELASALSAYATGETVALPALAIRYADFAAWDRSAERWDALDQGRSYWRTELADPPVLQLPTDHPRPSAPAEDAGSVDLVLPADLLVSLRKIAHGEQTTLFSVFLAALTALLHRYTGNSDIVVSCPMAGRGQVETEPLIGVFINTLPLRTRLTVDDTFRQLLRRVHDCVIRGLDYQEVPHQFIVRDVLNNRDPGDSPLYQSLFTYERVPSQPRTAGGLVIEPEDAGPGATTVDLSLELNESAEEVRGRFVYLSVLWEPTTMKRLAGHFLTMLGGIAADADSRLVKLPLLTEAERHQLLVEWNDTADGYPVEKCVHELFEEQVERTPDAVAVVSGKSRLTYRELNERANRLAHHLRRLGVGPEVLVGLCVDRSVELVVGLLGTLKAGGAYVPLDPDSPRDRLAFMIEDTTAPILLTCAGQLDRLPATSADVVVLDRDWASIAENPSEQFEGGASLENLVYVMYTSGSTGRPKGVMIHHLGLANYLAWCARAYAIDQGTGAPVHGSIASDLTVTSLLAPLLSGRRLDLLDQRLGIEQLSGAFRVAQNYSLVKITPAHLRALADQLAPDDSAGRTRAFVIGGEQLTADHIAFWREHAPEIDLFNEYGPTETVVASTFYRVPRDEPIEGAIPIGRPIAGTRIYVLDRNREPVPIGVPGELYIGGAGVARGYLGQPGLTAERFLSDPFTLEPGSRIYRTGDIGRWRSDGNLEFLGRADGQVKIRGYRVELGEVEATLAAHPSVREAAVITRDCGPDDRRLVAFLTARPGVRAPEVSELRRWLADRLPDYMVPSSFAVLDALPITQSGKIDRRALPGPDESRPQREREYTAPRGPIEEQLAGIWCEVLRLDRVGIHDNFFALGGDSLRATRAAARIRLALQADLPLRKLFEAPTIAGLSAEIELSRRRGIAAARVPLTRLEETEKDRLPLSFAQERLWFLERLEGALTAYNMPFAWRVRGPLNVEALRQAL
jgi:amino acid adenylation domain-containing protein